MADLPPPEGEIVDRFYVAEPQVDHDPMADLVNALRSLSDLQVTIEEGTLADLAGRLDVLQVIAKLVGDLTAQVQMLCAERMEYDQERFDGIGWLVREYKYSTAGSDWQGARDAARIEIATRVARNPETGEIIPGIRSAVHDALQLMEHCMSVGAPKQGFREVLGLDLDAFMKRQPAGYKVTIKEHLG